ncbi:hypothetical protein scyTo_0012854, partial [Scyliorhinus torazame]|nr:hypothetical protein [Scyliorhinus torazame]
PLGVPRGVAVTSRARCRAPRDRRREEEPLPVIKQVKSNL